MGAAKQVITEQGGARGLALPDCIARGLGDLLVSVLLQQYQ